MRVPARGEQDQVDMDLLRRRGLAAVWAAFLSYSAVFLAAFLGWRRLPGVDAEGGERLRDTDTWKRAFVIGGALVGVFICSFLQLLLFHDFQVVSNLPDLASIGIYLAMRRHFRTQSAAAKQAQVCAIIVCQRIYRTTTLHIHISLGT